MNTTHTIPFDEDAAADWAIYISDGTEVGERGTCAVVVARTAGLDVDGAWWVSDTRTVDIDNLDRPLDVALPELFAAEIAAAKAAVEAEAGPITWVPDHTEAESGVSVVRSR